MKTPRLREWRESKGETQLTLSERSGVAEHTISRIEHGAELRPTTARKLADALDVEVADLMESPPAPLSSLVSEAPPKAESPDTGLDELLGAAREIKAEWMRLAAYERVIGLSREEHLRTLRRLEELDRRMDEIKERVDEIQPPLCRITYYDPDRLPLVEFYRDPTPEEEADLREKHGDYEVKEDVFALTAS